MAQLSTEYYRGNDQYSDGEIEDRILQIVQEEKSLDASGDRSFPVLYHLSQVRENILSWYDFRKGASVLEIGAGPGAITGLLCRKCAKVTSVELSMRRSRINYERNRAYENLTIMVGNLNDMMFEERFDYCILNGVFEYAGSFTEGEDPYGDFLKRCAGYLKEDGLLLIAIENRLGLKYFAGAPEDHTDQYMEGLKDYPDNPAVHTFSKKEWEKLCDRCGLPWRKFYYPYPDYKFPNEIFTKETLRADSFGKNAWNFNPRRLELFSEQEMGQTLCREGVMECFMNSFLIEAGSLRAGEERARPGILYAKVNSDRAPRFRIQTVICQAPDGRKTVTKSPLTKEARAHLRKMHDRERNAQDACFLLQGELQEDGSCVYPFLSGKSLEEMILPDASSIRSACSRLREMILVNEVKDKVDPEGFARLFGSSCPDPEPGACPMVSPANIDLIFDNVFPGPGGDLVIDGEWITDTPVPADFLVWRSVNELYASRREMERALPREKLLEELGISLARAQVFWKWATHFEKEYVRGNSLAAFAVPVRRPDLGDLQWSGQDVRLTASLYQDRGKGFHEEDALHVDVVLDNGRYDVTFELANPDQIRALRFDPLEGCACVCDLHSEEGILKPVNASAKTRGGDAFLTMDPAYRVFCRQIPAKIRITGVVRTKGIHWALDKSQELLSRSGRNVARSFWRRAKEHLRR